MTRRRGATIRCVGRSVRFVETRTRREVAWVREDLAHLGLDAFWRQLEPLAGAKGRGGVGRLDVEGCAMVVRPYRRGGALGGLLADRYPTPARARDELRVLCALDEQGVPAVAPVAAVARKRGAFWRLRLCTEWVGDARPLPEFFADLPSRRRQATVAVADAVRRAFEAGLRHPDLHVDNVLCTPDGDDVQAMLVDLDRARLQPPLTERGRDDMLARMQRYCVKHRGELPAAPTLAETMRFLVGLGLPRDERRALWRRLAARVDRATRRRRALGR